MYDLVVIMKAHFVAQREEKTDEQLYKEWTEKFGQEGADVIRKTVEANVADYEYLEQFAVKV